MPDVILRGCLRILAAMPTRGAQKSTEEDNSEIVTAWPLIRWSIENNSCEHLEPGEAYPYIVCVGTPMETGRYFVYIGDEPIV